MPSFFLILKILSFLFSIFILNHQIGFDINSVTHLFDNVSHYFQNYSLNLENKKALTELHRIQAVNDKLAFEKEQLEKLIKEATKESLLERDRKWKLFQESFFNLLTVFLTWLQSFSESNLLDEKLCSQYTQAVVDLEEMIASELSVIKNKKCSLEMLQNNLSLTKENLEILHTTQITTRAHFVYTNTMACDLAQRIDTQTQLLQAVVTSNTRGLGVHLNPSLGVMPANTFAIPNHLDSITESKRLHTLTPELDYNIRSFQEQLASNLTKQEEIQNELIALEQRAVRVQNLEGQLLTLKTDPINTLPSKKGNYDLVFQLKTLLLMRNLFHCIYLFADIYEIYLDPRTLLFCTLFTSGLYSSYYLYGIYGGAFSTIFSWGMSGIKYFFN